MKSHCKRYNHPDSLCGIAVDSNPKISFHLIEDFFESPNIKNKCKKCILYGLRVYEKCPNIIFN